MKTKLQEILANVTAEEAVLLRDLASSYLENCVMNDDETPSVLRPLVDRMESDGGGRRRGLVRSAQGGARRPRVDRGKGRRRREAV